MNSKQTVRDDVEFLPVSSSWRNVENTDPLFAFAEDVILFLVVLPLIFELHELFLTSSAVWAAMLLLPEFFALTFFRLRMKRRITFAGSTLGCAAVSAAVSLLLGSWPAALASAGAWIVCLAKFRKMLALRDAAMEHLAAPVKTYLGIGIVWFSLFLSLIVYLDAFRRGSKALMIFSTAVFVTVCILMFIYSHAYGRNCFAVWEKISGTEEKAPQKFGNGFFAVLAAVCFSVLAVLGIGTAYVTGASRVDEAFLNFLLNGFNYQLPKDTQDIFSNSSTGLSDEMKKQLEEATPQSPVLAAIGIALKIFFFALLAAAVILLLIYGVRAHLLFLRRLGGGVGEDRRTVFFDMKPIAAARKNFRRAAGDLALLARGSNRVKIRRMFFAFVRRRRTAAKIQGSDAPSEIARKVGAEAEEPEEAAALYEQARYAAGECSTAEVVRMQKSLRKKRSGTPS